MPTFQNHPILASSTVATAPSPATSGTSLIVASGEGTLFGTGPYQILIWPAGAQPTLANAEIATCSSRSTDTLTITRAQEGTAARTVVIGDQVAAIITGKHFTDLETAFTGDSGSGGSKGLVPAPSAGDAAASKFLSAAGTWSTAGGGTPRVSIGFPSTATYEESVTSSAAIAKAYYGVTLTASATTNSSATIRTEGAYTNVEDGGMKNMAATIQANFTSNTGTGEAVLMSYGSGVPTTSGSYTASHAGYKFARSGSTITSSATNANGTTETVTSVTVNNINSKVNAFTTFETDGTNVKYYVAGVLRATHTTNLPAGNNNYNKTGPCYFIKNTGSATNEMTVNRSTLSWELF